MKTFIGLFLLFAIFFLYSCDKENGQKKACWQLIDAQGRDVNLICDKTEAEMIACVKSGACPVYVGLSLSDFGSCDYYETGGEKSCWRVGNFLYTDITANKAKVLAACYPYGAATPTLSNSCDSCQSWYHREKKTYKPANTFTYSPVHIENFCGDTLATLYTGRQIIKKDDADSLIVIQFSNNGSDW